jgi:hypothetical protein
VSSPCNNCQRQIHSASNNMQACLADCRPCSGAHHVAGGRQPFGLRAPEARMVWLYATAQVAGVKESS